LKQGSSLNSLLNQGSELAISSDNFNTNFTELVFGSVFLGVQDAHHVKFGGLGVDEKKDERYIISKNKLLLNKGTYLSFQCVMGEVDEGSIKLDDTPDVSSEENIIMEVSIDGNNWTRLQGIVNSATVTNYDYSNCKFLMNLSSNEYFLRIKQDKYTDTDSDYFAIKNLRYNMGCIYVMQNIC